MDKIGRRPDNHRYEVFYLSNTTVLSILPVLSKLFLGINIYAFKYEYADIE